MKLSSDYDVMGGGREGAGTKHRMLFLRCSVEHSSRLMHECDLLRKSNFPNQYMLE